jgi:FixJ family two-component response regulator
MEILRDGARMECNGTIVYVASNDLVERERLARFCSSQGVNISTFCSTHELLETGRDDRTACLILDWDLHGMNALRLQNELQRTGAPPVIFLTACSDLSIGVRAIKNGAIDILLKPVDYLHLRTAIDVAFDQDRRNRNEWMEREALLTRWKTLTPREEEVFHHTVAGLLNKQGAAELGVRENTYQVHRGRVMRKMQATSLADLVRMSTKLEPILEALSQDKHGVQPLCAILEGPNEAESFRRYGLTWDSALESGGMLGGDEVTVSLDVQLVKA